MSGLGIGPLRGQFNQQKNLFVKIEHAIKSSKDDRKKGYNHNQWSQVKSKIEVLLHHRSELTELKKLNIDKTKLKGELDHVNAKLEKLFKYLNNYLNKQFSHSTSKRCVKRSKYKEGLIVSSQDTILNQYITFYKEVMNLKNRVKPISDLEIDLNGSKINPEAFLKDTSKNLINEIKLLLVERIGDEKKYFKAPRPMEYRSAFDQDLKGFVRSLFSGTKSFSRVYFGSSAHIRINKRLNRYVQFRQQLQSMIKQLQAIDADDSNKDLLIKSLQRYSSQCDQYAKTHLSAYFRDKKASYDAISGSNFRFGATTIKHEVIDIKLKYCSLFDYKIDQDSSLEYFVEDKEQTDIEQLDQALKSAINSSKDVSQKVTELRRICSDMLYEKIHPQIQKKINEKKLKNEGDIVTEFSKEFASDPIHDVIENAYKDNIVELLSKELETPKTKTQKESLLLTLGITGVKVNDTGDFIPQFDKASQQSTAYLTFNFSPKPVCSRVSKRYIKEWKPKNSELIVSDIIKQNNPISFSHQDASITKDTNVQAKIFFADRINFLKRSDQLKFDLRLDQDRCWMNKVPLLKEVFQVNTSYNQLCLGHLLNEISNSLEIPKLQAKTIIANYLYFYQEFQNNPVKPTTELEIHTSADTYAKTMTREELHVNEGDIEKIMNLLTPEDRLKSLKEFVTNNLAPYDVLTHTLNTELDKTTSVVEFMLRLQQPDLKTDVCYKHMPVGSIFGGDRSDFVSALDQIQHVFSELCDHHYDLLCIENQEKLIEHIKLILINSKRMSAAEVPYANDFCTRIAVSLADMMYESIESAIFSQENPEYSTVHGSQFLNEENKIQIWDAYIQPDFNVLYTDTLSKPLPGFPPEIFDDEDALGQTLEKENLFIKDIATKDDLEIKSKIIELEKSLTASDTANRIETEAIIIELYAYLDTKNSSDSGTASEFFILGKLCDAIAQSKRSQNTVALPADSPENKQLEFLKSQLEKEFTYDYLVEKLAFINQRGILTHEGLPEVDIQLKVDTFIKAYLNPLNQKTINAIELRFIQDMSQNIQTSSATVKEFNECFIQLKSELDLKKNKIDNATKNLGYLDADGINQIYTHFCSHFPGLLLTASLKQNIKKQDLSLEKIVNRLETQQRSSDPIYIEPFLEDSLKTFLDSFKQFFNHLGVNVDLLGGSENQDFKKYVGTLIYFLINYCNNNHMEEEYLHLTRIFYDLFNIPYDIDAELLADHIKESDLLLDTPANLKDCFDDIFENHNSKVEDIFNFGSILEKLSKVDIDPLSTVDFDFDILKEPPIKDDKDEKKYHSNVINFYAKSLKKIMLLREATQKLHDIFVPDRLCWSAKLKSSDMIQSIKKKSEDEREKLKANKELFQDFALDNEIRFDEDEKYFDDKTNGSLKLIDKIKKLRATFSNLTDNEIKQHLFFYGFAYTSKPNISISSNTNYFQFDNYSQFDIVVQQAMKADPAILAHDEPTEAFFQRLEEVLTEMFEKYSFIKESSVGTKKFVQSWIKAHKEDIQLKFESMKDKFFSMCLPIWQQCVQANPKEYLDGDLGDLHFTDFDFNEFIKLAIRNENPAPFSLIKDGVVQAKNVTFKEDFLEKLRGVQTLTEPPLGIARVRYDELVKLNPQDIKPWFYKLNLLENETTKQDFSSNLEAYFTSIDIFNDIEQIKTKFIDFLKSFPAEQQLSDPNIDGYLKFLPTSLENLIDFVTSVHFLGVSKSGNIEFDKKYVEFINTTAKELSGGQLDLFGKMDNLFKDFLVDEKFLIATMPKTDSFSVEDWQGAPSFVRENQGDHHYKFYKKVSAGDESVYSQQGVLENCPNYFLDEYKGPDGNSYCSLMQRDTSSTSSDSVAYKEISTFKEAYSLDLAMLNYLISIKRHDLRLNPEELIEISEEGGEEEKKEQEQEVDVD